MKKIVVIALAVCSFGLSEVSNAQSIGDTNLSNNLKNIKKTRMDTAFTQTSNSMKRGSEGTTITLYGTGAGISNTCNYLTAIGLNSGHNAGGKYVTDLGYSAGWYSTGDYATNVGHGAGTYALGSYNTNIGFGACWGVSSNTSQISSGYNTMIGSYAGFKTTIGSENTYLGASAGYNTTTGTENVLIGEYAGYSLTTGTSNLFLGSATGWNITTGSNNIIIGNDAGYNLTATSSNILYIESNVSSQKPLIGGDFSARTVTIDAGIKFYGSTGQIWAQEIQVAATSPWGDYVFNKDYKLTNLNELESYITTNKHLPNVPSATEMNAKGINIGEINTVLMVKVEELTLYLLQQNKQIEELKAQVKTLNTQISK